MSRLALFLIAKTYNPNQSRDYHGRFGSGGGSAATASKAAASADSDAQKAHQAARFGTRDVLRGRASRKDPRVQAAYAAHAKAAAIHAEAARLHSAAGNHLQAFRHKVDAAIHTMGTVGSTLSHVG